MDVTEADPSRKKLWICRDDSGQGTHQRLGEEDLLMEFLSFTCRMVDFICLLECAREANSIDILSDLAEIGLYLSISIIVPVTVCNYK